MLNQVVLIGRLVSDPKINETENKRITTTTLAVTRSYKNMNGEYDTDFIPCILWNAIATNFCEYCRKGDLVAIKGRVKKPKDEELSIIAEKVMFLSSGKGNE